jgi:serine/threonine-protein kinase HipA
MGVEGLRLSLAGVQEKAAVCLVDGEIAVPLEGTPTTHILKPTISKFPGSVQNEYLCLRTAARLALPVPEVKMGRAGKESGTQFDHGVLDKVVAQAQRNANTLAKIK